MASDMHLGEHDPATLEFFLASLDAQAAGLTDLFLLGDLFESWVGDDQDDRASLELLKALGRLSQQAIRIWILPGNRDFLLDKPSAAPVRWCERASAKRLEDPCIVDFFGERTLLAHGDALCSDDHAYQALRARLRERPWQSAFLAQPMAERLAFARDLRMRSQHETAQKLDSLTDVNQQTVAQAMRDAGVLRLVHGHTHRPARHDFQLDQHAATRWVLPDWEAAAGRGGFLRIDAQGWHRLGGWG
jgi:UDP-2,3-diacylglucosamine hydrolase